MGDCFYYKNNVKTRLELKLGDGTNLGKKIIPIYKNQSGESMQLPQLQNMIINLCKYSFLLNSTKSCSQYIDNSDLLIGKTVISNNRKNITTNEFQNKFANIEENFNTISNNQYAINTNKGIWFIKKNTNENGLGFILPNNKALLSNEGDSFTLSFTFAFNNPNNWCDMLQIIKKDSTRRNDGYLRIEKGDNSSLNIFYTKSNASDNGQDNIKLSDNTNDKIQNVILKATREVTTNKLIVTAFYNGIKKADNQIMATYRISPMDLICFNIGQSDDKANMHLFISSFRLWDTGLSDDEISMLSKIEARNLGLEVLPENGINLWNYLRN